MPLTENQAKNAKPFERAYKLADSEGLFLLVQPNGAKLWRMKYRFAGKEKLLSFGAYPALGIAAAREKRRVAKAVLAEGKDPMLTKVLSDTLLRTDSASGATTHLLELEIARALKPFTLKRLEELHGLAGQPQRPDRNARSGRVALLVPARSILADDGTRVARFELLRPLKRNHITEDQLAESSWEHIHVGEFREAWAAEVEEARSSHKRERLYLATGLLLPVWDKLPSDFVRVSRISAADGRSLLGREVSVHCVPELCRAMGLEREQTLSADDIVQTVLATGRAMEFAGREQLMVKRSLVNGSQRIELTGWSAARLDWYKAQNRYKSRAMQDIAYASQPFAA